MAQFFSVSNNFFFSFPGSSRRLDHQVHQRAAMRGSGAGGASVNAFDRHGKHGHFKGGCGWLVVNSPKNTKVKYVKSI